MIYLVTKTLISALILVAVSEIAKKSPFWGGALASLPLVSLLAMIWLYIDSKSVEKVAELSSSIFWLVLPTLPMFIALPALLKAGLGFYSALGIAALLTIALYLAMILVLKNFGMAP
ncbi:MAG: DUF3147 family protein [Candidatus Binatia bacterium]